MVLLVPLLRPTVLAGTWTGIGRRPDPEHHHRRCATGRPGGPWMWPGSTPFSNHCSSVRCCCWSAASSSSRRIGRRRCIRTVRTAAANTPARESRRGDGETKLQRRRQLLAASSPRHTLTARIRTDPALYIVCTPEYDASLHKRHLQARRRRRKHPPQKKLKVRQRSSRRHRRRRGGETHKNTHSLTHTAPGVCTPAGGAYGWALCPVWLGGGVVGNARGEVCVCVFAVHNVYSRPVE